VFSDIVRETVIYEHVPKTFGRFQTRGAQTFQKSRSYIKILGTGRVTMKQVPYSGYTKICYGVHNFAAGATWCPGCAHIYLKHNVTE